MDGVREKVPWMFWDRTNSRLLVVPVKALGHHRKDMKLAVSRGSMAMGEATICPRSPNHKKRQPSIAWLITFIEFDVVGLYLFVHIS